MALAGLFGVSLLAFASAQAATTTVRVGFQPWPGVTVKTEIASQLLEAIGYEAEQKQLGTTIILQGIANDQLDVNFGIWYPLFKNKFDPFVQKGTVERLQTNLARTTTAVAVPEYVHAAGVDSVTDLQKYADRFGHKIYGIEPGAAWNNYIEATIKAGQYGLGDWKLVPSSTSGMLAQVQRAVSKKDWIVFHSWEPHWMHVAFDIHYLKTPTDSKVKQRHGSVYTVTRPDYPQQQPNVARFLRQFRVTDDMQNEWIYQYKYKDHPQDAVARKWISAHLDVVKHWLNGVKTADGQRDAFASVKSKYAN